MTTEYDQKIAEARAEAQRILDEMQQVSDRLIDRISDFVLHWVREVIQEQVTRQHDVTKRLDDESLRNLKADMNRTADELSERVRTLLGGDNLWDHRQGEHLLGEQNQYLQSSFTTAGGVRFRGYTLGDRLSAPVEEALHSLWDVLERYGYKEVSGQNFVRSGSVKIGNWSDDVLELAQEYDRLRSKVREVRKTIEQLVSEKTKAEIRTRWDKL